MLSDAGRKIAKRFGCERRRTRWSFLLATLRFQTRSSPLVAACAPARTRGRVAQAAVIRRARHLPAHEGDRRTVGLGAIRRSPTATR